MAEPKSKKSELALAGGFDELRSVLEAAPKVTVPASRAELIELALHGQDRFEVSYQVPGKGDYVEAVVNRCRNGASVNYSEAYMRRRDPNCMVIADDEPTDKPRYRDRFSDDFTPLRDETLEWLKQQNLIVLPFMAGGSTYGYPSVLVVPENAGFFAAGLADLQGFLPPDELPRDFKVRATLIVAPPFRHTHFSGEQVVVHNRTSDRHEIYSYNLYPGPSAKKGIYGVLLTIGEDEGWTTLHGSTVKVITPYDNIVTIMHEGASGGGKSEMIERMHKELDGHIVVGENLVTGESIQMTLSDSCSLRPVTDDMALCHPKLAESIGDNNYRSGKLIVTDAEAGWFLRVNHIDRYGTDPFYERLSIHPPEPLIFLNLDASPGATCLIWEHTMDSPGVPCPNPRVIMPRAFVEDIENEPVRVDVRSFGIRVPPCTKDNPFLRHCGAFPHSSVFSGLAVAPGCTAGPRQPQHYPQRGAQQRGGGVVLALCHREDGGSGQSASHPNRENTGHALQAHSKSAYRSLQSQLYAPVDSAGVSGAQGQRKVQARAAGKFALPAFGDHPRRTQSGRTRYPAGPPAGEPSARGGQ